MKKLACIVFLAALMVLAGCEEMSTYTFINKSGFTVHVNPKGQAGFPLKPGETKEITHTGDDLHFGYEYQPTNLVIEQITGKTVVFIDQK
ncbi:MAG: hypothetical protein LBC72_00465 [Spirochaetaceae bacterium]|jgi:hypothetical protein|nr:hypothetical protein [Spirochaetaceae bacterium]